MRWPIRIVSETCPDNPFAIAWYLEQRRVRRARLRSVLLACGVLAALVIAVTLAAPPW
jgi:hypothetical protein